jgi:hypothetical protein
MTVRTSDPVSRRALTDARIASRETMAEVDNDKRHTVYRRLRLYDRCCSTFRCEGID